MTLRGLLALMLHCSALRHAGVVRRQAVRLSSTLPHVADEALLRRRDEPYTRAITRSGRRGEWRRAIALLDALERRHELVSVRAGTAALVACDRAGCGRGLGGAPRWAEAQEILGRRSFAPDAFTYTTALRCLGRASRPADVAARERHRRGVSHAAAASPKRGLSSPRALPASGRPDDAAQRGCDARGAASTR